MLVKLFVVLFVVLGTVLMRECKGASTGSRDAGTGSKADCTELSCLNCGPKGCQKCPKLIVYPSRNCVDVCPFGHHESWSTQVDFMGLVCVHNGNFLGLSSDTLTILTGVFAGLLLCLVTFFVAFVYIKFRRKRGVVVSDTSSESDESTPEKKDFLKQLETLRPYSQCYLDMLNDTRQQIRQLHREGDHSAVAAYKPVVRDLAKILFLLNRSVDSVSMPDDWEHVLNWAEKALKRYKRMSDSSSQPQVAQLINFLQSPIIPSDVEEIEYSVRGSTTMSTFKPDQPFGSSLSLQTAAIKTFSTNYEKLSASNLNPEWKFEYSLVGTSSEFDPIAWKSSKEFMSGSPLFLEDDFYQLGFRPQDEITTEL